MSTDSNPENEIQRDPDDWKTGDEPITEAQRSYLTTLATEAGEPLPDLEKMTKAEASIKIDELRERAGLAEG
jgi:hypothetical protein